MAAQPDLTRLLVMLAASCSKVLEAERTSIWVVDLQTGDLYTRVAEGMGAIHVPRGKGIVGAVAESAQTVLIPDAYADPRFNPEVDRTSGFRTRDILCLPLKDIEGTRVVGVLQALNKTDGAMDDYDVELASIIGAQVGVVLEQAALREQAMERKRLQAEMDLARSIQQRLLPSRSPQVKGLDIAGANTPATETSGDYFDYVPLPDGRLGVVIADVTGHGLGAALVMTAARAFVRAWCGTESDPGKILGGCNNLLEKDLDAGNFLSLCLAAFDPRRGTLAYASAGHDPPLVYRSTEDGFSELESTGPLLGVAEGMEFGVSGPVPLLCGDVLLFMTDGLFECMNERDETFGKERLKEIIRARSNDSAADILGALLEATRAWTAGKPPRDDITVVVVRVGEGFGTKDER
ncbi:MAG: SpoIIE family protein phosphatase [Planctomycetota bacterium]|nr:SpoIIE family protein phosphatase [Planctomycetota bacterium]